MVPHLCRDEFCRAFLDLSPLDGIELRELPFHIDRHDGSSSSTTSVQDMSFSKRVVVFQLRIVMSWYTGIETSRLR